MAHQAKDTKNRVTQSNPQAEEQKHPRLYRALLHIQQVGLITLLIISLVFFPILKRWPRAFLSESIIFLINFIIVLVIGIYWWVLDFLDFKHGYDQYLDQERKHH